jgi:hypothetical protein
MIECELDGIRKRRLRCPGSHDKDEDMKFQDLQILRLLFLGQR